MTSAEPPNFENEEFLSQYATRLADIPEVAAAWEEYERRRKQVRDLETQQASLAARRDSVLKAIKELSAKRGVLDLTGGLQFMRKLGFVWLATRPGQLLTLLLTLSMGALGSLNYITRDYFNPKPNRTFSWYLFRPFLGMVTAVAVFVLAKAGQLTISDGSIGDSAAENLNPYFISFLAIISGLLSEQATEKIRSVGAGLFQSETPDRAGAARWAVNLRARIDERGKSDEQLVEFIEHSSADIEAWIAEKRAVPADAQRSIASWLGVPIRGLFTDLPPKSHEPQDANDQNEANK